MATASKIGVGATNITNLGTVTTGTWNASIIGLAYGGTNANLTASNGGIAYSTSSAIAVKTATATANQGVFSASNTTPVFSTATYPATITANYLLYSSANNVVAGKPTAANEVICCAGNGLVAPVVLNTNGNLLIGSTGATPVNTNTSASTNQGIVVTRGAGTLNYSFQGNTINQNSASITPIAGSVIYINNGASLVTVTLNTLSPGDYIEIIGNSSGGWKLGQAANVKITLPGGTQTTTGTSGSISSNNRYDKIKVRRTETANTFVVESVTGSPSYV